MAAAFSPGPVVSVQNRFAAIAEDEAQALSPEVHILSEGSDMESCWETAQVNSAPADRRLRLVWDFSIHWDVRAAEGLLRNVAARIGGQLVGSEIPRVVRQQRWSPMNVPLIWAAAGGEDRTPVWEWLMSLLSQTTEVLEFHEGNIAAEVAVQTGWSALRSVFRTWSIMDREGLTEWLRSQGFAGSQPGNHIPARAQEFILEQACREDARVALLESAYVAAAVLRGRQFGLRTADPATSATHRGVHQRHNGLPADCWEKLDSVDVKEVMLWRVPMLRCCPYFMKGRLRECFATALRERHREALIGDNEVQVRAWKLFALIPTLLFQRPRGTGSIGRAELAQRVEGFFQGRGLSLVSQTCDFKRSAPAKDVTTVEEEQEKRGRAAQAKIQMGQVSRARHVLTLASLAPKTDATFNQLQDRRPQEQVREIPREVMEFVPERD